MNYKLISGFALACFVNVAIAQTTPTTNRTDTGNRARQRGGEICGRRCQVGSTDGADTRQAPQHDRERRQRERGQRPPETETGLLIEEHRAHDGEQRPAQQQQRARRLLRPQRRETGQARADREQHAGDEDLDGEAPAGDAGDVVGLGHVVSMRHIPTAREGRGTATGNAGTLRDRGALARGTATRRWWE